LQVEAPPGGSRKDTNPREFKQIPVFGHSGSSSMRKSGVPKDGARDVPDVSLAASADHDGYLI
jgi:hypothetical protein